MQEVTVVIPNMNGEAYIRSCLDSLMRQTIGAFPVIVVDNGSKDDGVTIIRTEYPHVSVIALERNYGFCRAVNLGIQEAQTPFVILLNNDTVCEATFVEALVEAMKRRSDSFSCASKMVQMQHPDRMDNGGDYYCALGWAFACGKGRPAAQYCRSRKIFSSCAGAAIYRRAVFDEIGLFDEAHFAYLEDVDVAYRAKISGYQNYYAPEAVVRHIGSATSGSTYNEFKIRHSSQNSIYLIYKNMPWPQILINLPFLMTGFFVKMLFFVKKGYGKQYIAGLWRGIRLCDKSKKVRFQKGNFGNYLKIQCELWGNIFRIWSGI